MTPDELIVNAASFYFDSRDFNGYPANHIHREYGQSYETIRKLFADLVADGRGTVVFGDLHPNPHIRAFADEPAEKQLKKLKSSLLKNSCLYPSARYLSTIVASTDFQDRPFTRELALGAGQLEFRSFDLAVLEGYRNDPRYHYDNNDISGHICVTNEFYESDQMQERDQVLLETFGFSYDEKMNRAVASFLRYLSRLSPEHQQIWNSKRLPGVFNLHPDYYRTCILGDYGRGISIFNAFIKELKLINLMSAAMGRPGFFRNDFDNNRPRNFSFLVRPTQEEFNEFVLTLDKMMSDNINKKFFMDEVPYETEQEREDGRIVVRPKGTIAILEDWLILTVNLRDSEPLEEMITAFKQVRKLRQKPAHAVQADVFDQFFFHQQRKLVVSAYTAIMTLRQIFTDHHAVESANIKISDVLKEGKIWTQ